MRSQTKRLIGKVLVVVLFLAMFGIAALGISAILGGCNLLDLNNPELNKLSDKAKKLTVEITALKGKIKTLSEHILDLKKQHDEGKITYQTLMSQLPALYLEMEELYEQYQTTMAQLEKTTGAIKDLKEAGVPWYLIVLYTGLGIFGGAAGVGFKYHKEIKLLLDALGITCGAIENNVSQDKIKARIASFGNEKIAEIVQEIDPKTVKITGIQVVKIKDPEAEIKGNDGAGLPPKS